VIVSRLCSRRWCEGKAKILAVVGLTEETFRSADATVKALPVFPEAVHQERPEGVGCSLDRRPSHA
jgi:hypothetical protein